VKRFVLAGNPNSGKTTLFNILTGSSAHVGNWPGVTVDKREGFYKKIEEPIAILDLPGIYSLSPYSQEEIIARNAILVDKPDCIINVVDATNLERNLYLTTQLLEIDVPVIVALNMIDAVNRSGDVLDAASLEAKLGVPVIAISALKEHHIDQLINRAIEMSAAPRKATSILMESRLNETLTHFFNELEKRKIQYPLFHAVKLVEGDEIETKFHPELAQKLKVFKDNFVDDLFGGDFEAIIADERYKYIAKHLTPAKIKKTKTDIKTGHVQLTGSDKADRVLTNKWVGIPIFLAIMFLMFHLTFGQDLFYLNALGLFGSGGLVSFAGHPVFEGLFANGGVNSPGVILFNLMDIATSEVSRLVAGWLSSAPEWVSGFINDGVLGGVFAIMSFLPQILLLFLFFSILEDTGYMARIAFILDQLFRKFGLSGRAFIPMIMGFGCSVPATINTRTLASDQERIATIRVIPFFSCGAKLPILTAVSGAIVMQFGVKNADLITYGMYLLGIVAAIVAVLIMRHTTLKGETPPFIMELPSYHMPNPKSLLVHLWDKLKHFVQKAFTIILASTIVVWFVSHFSWSWQFLEDARMGESILAGLGQILVPLFTPLGFGSQLNGAFAWVFVVASLTGLIAKENVIATFGTIAASVGLLIPQAGEGVGEVASLIVATGITLPALISFIAFNMTTVPCFATIATAKAELPKGQLKWTILFWIGVSYLIGTAIYLIGTWWWTAFIFLGLAVMTTFIIVDQERRSKART
jgi:ferrous iron transport protein B